MKTRTNAIVVRGTAQNETLLREPIRAQALKVKTGVRVGKKAMKATK